MLAETLAQAGKSAGLPATLAEKLARATVAGAGELLHRSDLDAATLRNNVTSPGGTTAAALEILMGDSGLEGLMTKAVLAATLSCGRPGAQSSFPTFAEVAGHMRAHGALDMERAP